jgi:hypothetical protein
MASANAMIRLRAKAPELRQASKAMIAADGKDTREMTPADITLAAFTLCNSFRVLAYLPQIAKAARDGSGAEAISFATSGLFLVSPASAVAYALVNKEDWTMAAMFLANAVGCDIILIIAAWKRSWHLCRPPEQTA